MLDGGEDTQDTRKLSDDEEDEESVESSASDLKSSASEQKRRKTSYISPPADLTRHLHGGQKTYEKFNPHSVQTTSASPQRGSAASVYGDILGSGFPGGSDGGDEDVEGTAASIPTASDVTKNKIHQFIIRLAGALSRRSTSSLYVDGYDPRHDHEAYDSDKAYMGYRCKPEVLMGMECAWKHVEYLRESFNSRVMPGMKDMYEAAKDDGRIGLVFARLVASEIREFNSLNSELPETKFAANRRFTDRFNASQDVRATCKLPAPVPP